MNPHHHETNPHFVRPSQDDLVNDPSNPPQHHQFPTPPPTAGPTDRAHRDTRRSRDHRRRPEKQTPPLVGPSSDPHPRPPLSGPPAAAASDRFHRWPEQQNLPATDPSHDPHPRPPQTGPANRLHRWPEKQNLPAADPSRDPHPRPETSPWAKRKAREDEPGLPRLAPLHDHHPDEHNRFEPFRGRLPDQSSPDPLLGRHRHRRGRHSGGGGASMPAPGKTKATTWFGAVFCFVLWVVVILGGLAVLTVYLVFRPKSPQFEVSSATLNAAYLDMGYLLNADVSLLANFTNPNGKVSVEFGRMFVELYYGRTLVATQHLDPFTARRSRNTFANLHMVTSQVRLHELEVQRIKRQSLNNALFFELKGYFRARSNFGSLLRYSYWLHSTCTLMLTKPPAGVLVAKRCKTEH